MNLLALLNGSASLPKFPCAFCIAEGSVDRADAVTIALGTPTCELHAALVLLPVLAKAEQR